MMDEVYWPFLTPLIYMLALAAIAITLKLLFIHRKYKPSQYGLVSGNGFLKTVLDKGNYGEFLTFVFLEKLPGTNKILTNIYIPKEDVSTTEIDLLMINKTGVYVFESKNYSGWIFGDEKSKNWTQTLNGKTKNRFFNPIWQNKAHISALRKLLDEIDSKYFFSYIVFSERCELKKVPVSSPNVNVGKRNALLSILGKDIRQRPDVLADNQVSALYEILRTHSLADDAVKEQHIRSIKSRMETG